MKITNILVCITLSICCCHSILFAAHLTEIPICTNPASQVNPDLSDEYIVWQDNRNGNWDIYLYDMRRQMEIPICVADGNQINPSFAVGSILDELIIAWQDDRNGQWDIYGFRQGPDWVRYFEVGDEIIICDAPGDQINPESGGGYVCWQDQRNGNSDIYAKAFKFEQPETEFLVCDDPADQINPSVGHGTVTWQDNRNGDWDIMGYNIEDQNDLVIYVGDGNQTNPSTSTQGAFAFAWQDDSAGNSNISASFCKNILCELEDNIVKQATLDPDEQILPSSGDSYFIWQDNRSGDWDIYVYLFKSVYEGSEYLALGGDGDQVNPSANTYGQMVVWQDNRNGNDDIYAGIICKNGNDECGECAIELFEDEPFCGTTDHELYSISYPGEPEPNDISSCGFWDIVDVWHSFTPEVGGQVTISTDGSSLDTVLSVYNSCPPDVTGGPYPEELACNDDYSLQSTASMVTMEVIRGKKYHIRVAGFNGQIGDYRIKVSRSEDQPFLSDLNVDGKVDFTDFSMFASQWLKNKDD